MASMNWLGFSLYPQELPSHEEHSQTVSLGFNSEGISATDDVSGECCFDLTSHPSTTPHHHSLNHLPPSFAIFDALNRNTSSQDWSTKGNYNNQSLLLGTSCSNNQQQPKLENFLGQHSFGHNNNHQDHQTYGSNASASSGGGLMFPSCSLQLPAAEPSQLPEESAACDDGGGGGRGGGSPRNNNSIGLSMIKSWLRNQPPQKQPPSSSDAAAAAAANISLSMSRVSQSTSSVALPLLGANVDGESSSSDNNNKQQQQNATALEGQAGAIVESTAVPSRKAIDTFGQRTSIYRGVTRHRWTGRYEAHLWDNSCRREGQTRKGRQVYLGGYDKEEKAARAYDLAALKYWGTTTTTNFPISNYEKELEEMKHMTRQEYIASLRRKSSGFSRGASIYRGVTRHHQHGRWQARIGRVAGNKDLYLGTFSTQEEAAEAYDIAAIKFRGLNAVTNFEMSRYDVKSILESTTLPIGATAAKHLKDSNSIEQVELSVENMQQKSSSEDHSMNSSHLSYGGANNNQHGWPNSLQFQQLPLQPYSQIMHSNYHYGNHQKLWCKQEQDVVVDASHQSTFQDIHHMLQLGNNTHNFFQTNSGVHSFMSIDGSASIDNNSSGSSNPVIYGDAGGYMIPIGNDGGGNQNQRSSNNGFGGDNNEMKLLGYENVVNSSDPYYHHGRNLYYHSEDHAVKGSAFDACNTATTWVPTAIPTTLAAAATRPNNNMALCTGAPPFTLLHE